MSKIAYELQDNASELLYEDTRYLDALASLLHLQGDVAAAIEHNNKIYLSYNGNLTKQNEKNIKFIKNILNNISYCQEDHVLGTYLAFNMDFIKLAKKTRNHVLDDTKNLLEAYIDQYKTVNGALENNIKKLIPLGNNELAKDLRNHINQIVLAYKDIIVHMSSVDQNHLDGFLRPLQDSYKLYGFLCNRSAKYEDIIVISNPNNIHADCNIADYFKISAYLDNNYMGVSRLCCGYCHTYLDKQGYKHRGTHGVCDEKWQMNSPLEEIFKKNVKEIKAFDQSNQPIQYRKLSNDNFEQDIYVSLPNDENTYYYDNLRNIKNLNVVGEIMKLHFEE